MNRPTDYTDLALGLVSAQSFPAIVGIADHMLKSSDVHLIGYEKIGSGHCTAIVRGNISDVRLAVAEGAERASQFGQELSTLVLARPDPNLDQILPIGSRLAELTGKHSGHRLSSHAVGLLETRGFPAMVGAADAMLKAAEVVLTAYEVIGAGLCTVIVRGTASNAAMALEAGMAAADRIGELHAVMLVPRPLDELDQTLPLASCLLEQLQPIRIPLSLKQKETAPVLIQPASASQPLALEQPIAEAVPAVVEPTPVPKPRASRTRKNPPSA
ncbi:BMC domain-containing protein [Thermosynechococcaceae cyanobacterium BACA0444]|uniref:BMC domain-containing protein n=1 Tax=Pseudocalidococcus azoricus BACA0444 TaxID=2918990 RepID=A0AAE4JYM2_9CYAN|nr:BMC domain-containing protein [Pseudocalidococcus azoricus]MDS3861119.1 BMC domain-containing protein [Pseudocalidococcus azoricus BACA0444]